MPRTAESSSTSAMSECSLGFHSGWMKTRCTPYSRPAMRMRWPFFCSSAFAMCAAVSTQRAFTSTPPPSGTPRDTNDVYLVAISRYSASSRSARIRIAFAQGANSASTNTKKKGLLMEALYRRVESINADSLEWAQTRKPRTTLGGFPMQARALKRLAAAVFSTLALAAHAWEPTKPVEIVVAAGAGGASDQMARMIQAAVQKNNLMK